MIKKEFDTEELKGKLTKEQYEVLVKGSTEYPFTGKYLENKKNGMYVCPICGSELFSSDTKFDSKSGWPSFYDVAKEGKVNLIDDPSLGMQRTEVTCAKCGAHLGHLFEDAPNVPTGKRYCINSAALDFVPRD